MRSNKIEAYKTKLKLSRRQQEIIVGMLLGDGHLETMNGGKTYRLKIEHCIAQIEYVNWLYKELCEWVGTSPRKKRKSNGITSKTINIWFQTYSHSALRFYAHQFYIGRRKVVPRQIGKWLTPLAIAVWFMDDGSYKSKQHKALILNTQGFTDRDIMRLRKAIENKYNISSQVRKQKDGNQILIIGDNARKFTLLIKPYLLNLFYYKLGKLN